MKISDRQCSAIHTDLFLYDADDDNCLSVNRSDLTETAHNDQWCFIFLQSESYLNW